MEGGKYKDKDCLHFARMQQCTDQKKELKLGLIKNT